MFNKAKKHSELSDLNFALLMALPVLFFLLFVIIYPLGYAFWMSLHKVTMFGGFKFKFVGLTNYYKVLVNEKFWDAAFVSIRFTLESTFVTIFLGLIIAIILSKEFKYKTLILSNSTWAWWVGFLSNCSDMYTFEKTGWINPGKALRCHGIHVKNLWNIRNISKPIDGVFIDISKL